MMKVSNTSNDGDIRAKSKFISESRFGNKHCPNYEEDKYNAMKRDTVTTNYDHIVFAVRQDRDSKIQSC